MKKLGGLVGVFVTIVVVIYLFGNELLLFLLAGRLPFTNVIVPPIIMFLFWLLIVPVTMAIWRILDLSIWKAIESIGATHQRYLNRHIRLFTPPLTPTSISLISLTLLAIEAESRQTATSTPAVRRRFASLPA